LRKFNSNLLARNLARGFTGDLARTLRRSFTGGFTRDLARTLRRGLVGFSVNFGSSLHDITTVITRLSEVFNNGVHLLEGRGQLAGTLVRFFGVRFFVHLIILKIIVKNKNFHDQVK
jgi:hypothetical protein